jgi:uncharacterized protein YggE
MSPRKYSKCLVFLAGITAGGATLAPSDAAADPGAQDPQLIVVQGNGEVHVQPDSLHVDVGVESRSATLDDARDQVNRATRRVLDAVHALALDHLDAQTTVLQVSPVYAPQNGDAPPSISGYSASIQISVTLLGAPVAELGDLGARVLDAALAAGANSVGGLDVFLADPSAAQDEALTAAVRSARHDADVIAEAAGVTVTGLASIDDTAGPSYTPRGVVLQAAAIASTPLAVDDIVIQSSVTARFSFR